MGHEYVKENDVFSTDQNGVVPKPTDSDIENNHVLKADHTWGEGGGSGEVVDVKVNGDSVLDENNEAQITSYKEVTISEYNALPQSKETDGVLYCVKDAGGADAFPPLIFSDEEREIGVWRDGKPLYQKVLQNTMPKVTTDGTFANKQIDISDTDIDYPVNFIINMCMSSEGQYYVLPYLNNSGRIAKAFVTSNSRDKLITLVSNGTAFSELPVKIILQYTKTSDTAGSGTWNQQGSYAHHYSTTEHVIGTWIDGKPLYEKTISSNAERDGSVSTLQAIAHGISDLKEVISVDGFASFGNNGSWLPIIFSDNAGSTLSNSRVKIISIGLSNVNFEIGNNYNGDNKINKVRITIQYTKTTD